MTRESELHERLVGEGLLPSTWGNAPGYHYAGHRHPYDKVLVVSSGSITFHLPDADLEIRLEVGDRLDLPADTLHGADVGGDGVTCLEAHVAAGTLGDASRHIVGWATATR